MVEIKLDDMKIKPGMQVFVALHDGSRVKPVGIEIDSLVITIKKKKEATVQYLSGGAAVKEEDIFMDPWTCGQAIDIMDRHRKQVEQEISELKQKKEKENGK